MNSKVLFKPLDYNVKLPRYMTSGAAGMDVRARLNKPVTLRPGDRKLIPTGFALKIPEHFEVQVRPRSGLAIKKGITVLNSPGTIDSDYTGEVGVVLINHSKKSFKVVDQMRIAQLVMAPVAGMQLERTTKALPSTSRADKGFGSTDTCASKGVD